jgi:hypothetical protein
MVDCNSKRKTEPRGAAGPRANRWLLTLVAGAALTTGAWADSPPELPAQLQFALQQFTARGGAYELGPNDCSVFVTDYLKACGKPIKRRWTTVELWKPTLMEALGMRQVQFGETRQSVFCIRYINAKGKWVGHCGVVLNDDGETTFVHNSEAGGGVIVERTISFEARMLGVNVTLDQLRFFSP